MSSEFQIVTLCGSMRFFPQMQDAASALTRKGFIVVMPFVTIAPGEQIGNALKERLDRMHREKIRMADIVMVVSDETRYFGDSTMNEVIFAQNLGKRVVWYKSQLVEEL